MTRRRDRIALRGLRGVFLVAALLLPACSGNTPTAPAKPIAAAPVAAPAPQYPNLVGNWTGSLSIASTYTVQGLGTFTVRTVCTQTWRVDSQTGAYFVGSFQNSTPAGSTATCVQAGTLGGNVSTTGGVSGLSFNAIIGGSNCTRVAGDGVWGGSLLGTSASLSTGDTIRCPTPLTTFVYERGLTLFLSRQ